MKTMSVSPEDDELAGASPGWKMPRSGSLEIEFVMNPSEPSADEAASTHGVDGLLRNIAAGQTEAERRALFDMATRDPELEMHRAKASSAQRVHRLIWSRFCGTCEHSRAER